MCIRDSDDGATVTIDALIEKGIIKKTLDGVKILGQGELTKKLTVQANAFSDSASAKPALLLTLTPEHL